jgi:sRNA-binding protein
MKHSITTRPTRSDNEQVVRMLCEQYPKCFFDEPRQRRPLKQNIVADLVKDPDFDVAPELIESAVNWYRSHIGYDYAVSTIGSKRIDLNGREVGTVTEAEALVARQGIADKGSAIARRYPVRVENNQTKKLDAPPLSVRSKAPEFTPLYEILGTANAVVVGIDDPVMRAAVARTSLDVIIKKFQQVRSELDSACAGRSNVDDAP